MNRKLIWVFALIAGSAPLALRADVTLHNGNGGGAPTTYDIDLVEMHNFAFNFGTFTDVAVSGTNFNKTFNEMARHELTYAYVEVYTDDALAGGTATSPDASEPNVGQGLEIVEHVFNNTGEAWGGYRFGAMSADLYKACSSCAEDDPPISLFDIFTVPGLGPITVADIGWDVSMDVGEVDIEVVMEAGGPVVTLLFENPLDVGETFTLDYVVNYFDPSDPPSDADGFNLFQEPLPVNAIPAPGAVALAMVGFSLVGWVRRRLE